MTETGTVYKIVSDDKTMIYIGSTVNKLNLRLNSHVACFRKWMNGELDGFYSVFFIFLEAGSYNIEPIEIVQFNDINTLRQREQYWINNTDCINFTKAYRTLNEYNLYVETYRLTNKTKILESQRKYYETHKEQSKLYREQNKKKIKEYNKIWAAKNREYDLQRKREWYYKNKNKQNS